MYELRNEGIDSIDFVLIRAKRYTTQDLHCLQQFPSI